MLRRIKLSVATLAMASMVLSSAGSVTTFADTKDTAASQAETSKYDKKVVADVKSSSTLNIRKSPSEDAEIIGKMKKGNIANVIEKGEYWTKIKSGSVTGYVNNDYLVFGSEIEEYAEENVKQVAEVEAETLRVRESAGLEAEVLTLVDVGDTFTVKNTKDGWVKVKTSEGNGYVSEDYVDVDYRFGIAKSMEEIEAEEAAKRAAEEAKREAAERKAAAQNTSSSSSTSVSSSSSSSSSSTSTSSSSSSSSSSTSASSSSSSSSGYTPSSASNSSALSYASQFVGNPYKWGGTSLTNGCDCSGFVMQVFARYGVSLPHSSAAIRGYGKSVSYSDMQPGDVVCYDGHVGIYAGGGRLLSALNSASGITYNSVNYKQILSIRRML